MPKFSKILSIVVLFSLFTYMSCSTEDAAKISVPVVANLVVKDVWFADAVGSAKVLKDGGAPVTEVGICWSTNPNPTIGDEKKAVTNVTTAFELQFDGLESGTTYYARAYAINSAGVGYSGDFEFQTIPGDYQGTIADNNGNVYHAVKIGNLTWTVENFRGTKYRNGDAVPNVTGDAEWIALETGAYASYQNENKLTEIYGLLYNWYAVNDERNLAPEGWHVASLTDWNTLTELSGCDLRDTNPAYWQNDPCATNATGFSARIAGSRTETGSWGYRGPDGGYCQWWSTAPSEIQKYGMYTRTSANQQFGIGRLPAIFGMSVRLVKDN